MITALTLAIGDLGNPKILGILVRSLLISLLIFAGLGALAAWGLAGMDPCGWLTDDSCPLGAGTSTLSALLVAALALWLLFPAVAIGVISAYMDRIVAAVEAKHYPHAAATARPLGIAGGAALGLKSSARVLIYNLIALPFYLILLVTGIGPVILFVIVNGLAFGRDLGEMVARRHLDRAPRKAWLRATRSPRAVLGMFVTAIFLVPIANLLAPILAAAMATHLFHETRGNA